MSDSEDDPCRYTKAWVRANYDFDRETAPPAVQLVKFGHEWHIALPPALVGLVAVILFRITGSTITDSVLAAAAVFCAAYSLFFKQWWCSTLAKTESGQQVDESKTADERTAESEAEMTREQHQ